jgi:hypothetical protein
MRKLKYAFAYTTLAAYMVAGIILILGAFGNQWAQELLLSLVK